MLTKINTVYFFLKNHFLYICPNQKLKNMGKKKYFTEEERKAAKRASKRKWYYNKKEEIAAYKVEYDSTPFGRAINLLNAYKQKDKLYNRGECTITPDWIIQNIFNNPCHYCGESDWLKIGCDRIDNSLPHRPDNVVPCCDKCNKKRGTTPYGEYMRLIGKIA